jgi:hypothetical protein
MAEISLEEVLKMIKTRRGELHYQINVLHTKLKLLEKEDKEVAARQNELEYEMAGLAHHQPLMVNQEFLDCLKARENGAETFYRLTEIVLLVSVNLEDQEATIRKIGLGSIGAIPLTVIKSMCLSEKGAKDATAVCGLCLDTMSAAEAGTHYLSHIKKRSWE